MAQANRQDTRHLQLWPTTPGGHWSLRLIGLFVASFALTAGLVAAGARGVWLVVFPGSLVFGSAPAALVVGLMAVFRQHERSVAVVVAILVGALVLLFLLGEFAFPH